MAVLELLGRLVEFLGGVGPVLFGIALLLVAPYVDRLVVHRKRISFRVLYNSKIGPVAARTASARHRREPALLQRVPGERPQLGRAGRRCERKDNAEVIHKIRGE